MPEPDRVPAADLPPGTVRPAGQWAVANADGRLIERSRGGAVWNGYNHPLWVSLADENGKLPSEILIRMDRLRSAASDDPAYQSLVDRLAAGDGPEDGRPRVSATRGATER